MKKIEKEIYIEHKSLNTELYTDFSIEELEDRLETGPWVCNVYSPICVEYSGPPKEA